MHGPKHSKIFHLVAVDQRKRRDAKPIELLGVYNPRVIAETGEKKMEWAVQRIRYWLDQGGAQPSKPVVRLLERVRSWFECVVRPECLCYASIYREGLFRQTRNTTGQRPFLLPNRRLHKSLQQKHPSFLPSTRTSRRLHTITPCLRLRFRRTRLQPIQHSRIPARLGFRE